ncbi:GntR family transcriptional regulator / MocR family aminotransferase [Myxococcus fulvus]|uniref:GntR family transcriptional regulator n=1 Tax=Myxococcus fulvus TaxID=33 RepID=A0A511SVF0_MYXFU|nr:PLP-dependent aminotransferase family protein [Myxococcus fulvus]GEN05884.1 GntR family transcriptional regulator [Myxococcus fulvus]SET64544.1 GntR family transcriptional regulator / MocR family aminotransferase [Myxococcus fulvus]
MARHTGSVFSVDVSGLEPTRAQPVSARISDRLRAAIRQGSLVGNARLPSARTLAKDFGVARNTVEGALAQLVSEGYIVRRRGSGSFVATHLPEHDAPPLVPSPTPLGASAPSRPPRLSQRALALRDYPGHTVAARTLPFTPSLPPVRLFPRDIWNRLLAREAARPGTDYWTYGASNGLPALREAIAAHASAMRAVRCTPEQVVVVTSTQQAVELAGKALADPGDRVWVELPGYPPVRHCLRSIGLHIVDVPVDTEGLDVDAGRRLAPEARLAYVTPAHQYPLGHELSLTRRKALLDWARAADAHVIEDDYDGDYRYEGRPIASLQGMDAEDRVIYVGSFNKLLFPGLRIAYAIVPQALVGAFVDAKHVADGHTALLTQGVLAAFIQEGHLARHLRKTRAAYDERRRAFLEEARVLEPWLEFGPARAGLHVAAYFREDASRRWDDRAVAQACAKEGIEVHALSRYGATGRAGLVFGFASATRAATRSGLQVVRRVLEDGAGAPRKG